MFCTATLGISSELQRIIDRHCPTKRVVKKHNPTCPGKKLSDLQILQIKRKYRPFIKGKQKSNVAELAEEYGVTRHYIFAIGEGWAREKHLPTFK